MNSEALFRIVGFDQSSPWPTESWVIAGGNTATRPECAACGSEVGARSELCVEGYDEYGTGNFRERAFWPNDEELITLWEYAEEIAASLSGVVAVPVTYTDWNQSRHSARQLASKQPRLGALEIVGKAGGAYHAEAGILQNCAWRKCRGTLEIHRPMKPSEASAA